MQNWMLISAAVVSAGMLLWQARQNLGTGLSVQEAVQAMNREKAVLLDIRGDAAAETIKGAKRVTLAELDSKLPSLVKNKELPIVVLCERGITARTAVARAKKLGYSNAHVLLGGMQAWKQANMPVSKPA